MTSHARKALYCVQMLFSIRDGNYVDLHLQLLLEVSEDGQVKAFRIIFLLVCVAMVFTIPFCIFGYAGQDFQYHVTSWYELHQQWGSGLFTPGWAALSNFGLGDARLSVYPPVSFTAGTLLSELLPFKLVPGIFVMLCLLGCGVGMYYATEGFVSDHDRPLAAILYMTSPYILLAALIRFAAAELMTMIWLPFLLVAFYHTVWHRTLRSTLLLGCLLGLTWATNIPIAIALFYILTIATVIVCLSQKSLKPFLPYAAATGSGATLAAFQLIPSFLEQKWLNSDALHFDFKSYFLLSHRKPMGAAAFRDACWVFAAVECILLLVCMYGWYRGKMWDPRATIFSGLALLAFFFQLPWSGLFWTSLPDFFLVGFPFRFLAVMAAALPFVLLMKPTPEKFRVPFYVVLALMSCLPIFGYSRQKQSYKPASQLVLAFAHGYRGESEYVPTGGVHPSAQFHIDPVVQMNAHETGCSVQPISNTSQTHIYATQSDDGCMVRLAIFSHPYWHASDETNQPVKLDKTAEGFIVAAVPPGRHTIQIKFRADSKARLLSKALSGLALGIILILLAKGDRSSKLTSNPKSFASSAA